MSQSDRDRWNARWGERAGAPLEPSPWVVSLDPILPRRGRALDIAGGPGRHAVWLARRGLTVTLVDVSDEAMRLAADSAQAAGVSLALVDRDLEAEPLPEGPWDLVLCFHYLQRSLFPTIAAALAPGGLLVFCQQTRRNLERHPHPPERFLLAEREAPALVEGLEVVTYEEGWHEEGRHEARLAARRPAAAVAPATPERIA